MKPAPGGTTPNCVSYLALRAPGGRPLYIFSLRMIFYFGCAQHG
jgi:hypothetical protein